MAIAFWLRFNVLEGEGPVGPLWEHLAWAAVFIPVFIFLYGWFGVYDSHLANEPSKLVGKVVIADTLTIMLFIDCIFVFRIVDFSRWLIIFYWLFVCTLSSLKALLVNRRIRKRHERGLDRRSIIVVGSGKAARAYIDRIRSKSAEGFAIEGVVSRVKLDIDAPHLGTYEQLADILRHSYVDEVVVALDAEEQGELEEILLTCESSGIKVALLPPYFQLLSSSPRISSEGDMLLIGINRVALDNMGFAFVKRAFDVIGSLILIVLTSPIMAAAAIGTKLSSPGPVLFKQKRVGRGRRVFSMYKFRSMRVNDAQDSAWTVSGDPRRTKFGAFMRRYSIDELPQLFNVLRGDMSLVGPRPEIPEHVEHFRCNVPLYMVRHQVRPGMTGWAQINGLRGDTSIEARVEYDLFYIENWSLLFDLRILLSTPFKGIVNKQEPLIH